MGSSSFNLPSVKKAMIELDGEDLGTRLRAAAGGLQRVRVSLILSIHPGTHYNERKNLGCATLNSQSPP